MKTTDVVIELTSRMEAEETDSVSINTVGDMEWEDTTCRLRYETTDEDGAKSLTEIQVEGDTVSVLQQGSICSHLCVREGERTLSQYDTAYGTFTVGITGKRIAADLSALGGTLALEYDVDINAALVSSNSIEISVRRNSEYV